MVPLGADLAFYIWGRFGFWGQNSSFRFTVYLIFILSFSLKASEAFGLFPFPLRLKIFKKKSFCFDCKAFEEAKSVFFSFSNISQSSPSKNVVHSVHILCSPLFGL